MKIFIIISILLFLTVGQTSELTKKLLPANIQTLNFSKTKSSEVKKILGEPKKIDKKGNESTYFYNLNGVDFDSTFGFKNDKLIYIHVSNIPGDLSFVDFKEYFSETDVKAGLQEMNSGQGHEKGRSFEVLNKKEGLRLRFQNNSKKALLSAVLWASGQDKP